MNEKRRLKIRCKLDQREHVVEKKQRGSGGRRMLQEWIDKEGEKQCERLNHIGNG